MQILIVRHAAAAKADAVRFPDDDARPLTPKGARSFGRAAKGLRTLGLRPARVLSSPASRALATARILADRLGAEERDIKALDLLHHSASPAAALRSLGRKRLPARIAIVGHEPWLGRFASLLVSGRQTARLPLAKGGACLVEAEAMRPGAGSLAWSMTQEQLEAMVQRRAFKKRRRNHK